MRWSMLPAFLASFSFAPFAHAVDITGTGSGFSMYKTRVLADVFPFDASRLAETHQAMRHLGQLSLGPIFSQAIAEVETSAFPEFPTLVLVDNDNDTYADFFIYQTTAGPSDLYASFYAIEKSGPPAWIVFPVGPAMDDNREFLFLFSHWVDRNSDGKLDLLIQEDVDMDASGLPEPDSSAWLMDDDFDGLVDTAMHCVHLTCTKLAPQNGVFDLRLAFQQSEGGAAKVNEPFAAAPMLDALFGDLRAVRRKE